MATAKKRLIRNPEKWIGKYVRHMANWRDFQWPFPGEYFVDEWSGKLYRAADEYVFSQAEIDQLEAAGIDEAPLYYYGESGAIEMLRYAERKGV